MKPAINVTPLIDVLLVLLIIFMVITPLKPSAFKTKIPAEPNERTDAGANPNSLVVSLSGSREIYLNNEKTSTVDDPEKLIERLSKIFELRTQNGIFSESLAQKNELSASEKIERTVFIKAPRAVDYGTVARVVDAVKQSGASPIALKIDDLN